MLIEQGTISADGQTTGKLFPGGTLFMAVSGSLGGGTLKAQASYDNGTTYIDLIDTTNTSLALGTVSINLPDCLVRLSLSGATAPSITYAMSRRAAV